MDDREDKITDQRVASGIYPTTELFSAEKPCGHICGGYLTPPVISLKTTGESGIYIEPSPNSYSLFNSVHFPSFNSTRSPKLLVQWNDCGIFKIVDTEHTGYRSCESTTTIRFLE